MNAEAKSAAYQMLRWRGSLWIPLMALIVAAVGESLALIPAPILAAVLLLSGMAALIGMVCTWYYLFLTAQEIGGRGYAVSHLLFAIVLGPVGALVLPKLVLSDRETEFAEWRKSTATPKHFVVLRWIFASLGMVLGGALFRVEGAILGLLGGILCAYVVAPLARRVCGPMRRDETHSL